MENTHFLALDPVSNSQSQNTHYCALGLSSRRTNQAWTKVNIQRLYTGNINNKGCTHNHLSFWSYVLVYMGRSSCQQLANRHLEEKCKLAPWNKMSQVSNKWCQSMFGNKLMITLVTLKTMADQQSAWGISLKGVLVVVQCMRQYTKNSPGCSTAKYTNIGGKRQYTIQSWKPFLARWTITDHIGTVADCIGTVTSVGVIL